MNAVNPTYEEIEELKRAWTSQHVVVDASRPELKRFANRVGQVMTVNMNGRALVQFTETWGRYDISLPYLKRVEPPVPAKPSKAHATPKATEAGDDKPATPKKSPLDQMKAAAAKKSPLDQIRAKAGTAPAGPNDAPEPTGAATTNDAPAAPAKPSPLDQIRAGAKKSPLDQIRAKAAAKTDGAATPSAGEEVKCEPPAKLSPLELIRAKAAAAANKPADTATEKPDLPAEPDVPAAKLSPLEQIRAKAAKKSPLEQIRAAAAAKKAAEESGGEASHQNA